jgi:hypothetical protein
LRLGALPPFRVAPDGDRAGPYAYFRDAFTLSWLAYAVGAFSILTAVPKSALVWLVAVAMYRVFDLVLVVLSIGIMGTMYNEGPIESLPRLRVQRLVVGALVNHLELVLLFASIYLYASTAQPGAFTHATAQGALSYQEAMLLSMSNATTVGYGTVAPTNMAMILVSLLQATLSLVLFATVIGGCFSIVVRVQPAIVAGSEIEHLGSPAAAPLPSAPVGRTMRSDWWLPILLFFGSVAAIAFAIG